MTSTEKAPKVGYLYRIQWSKYTSKPKPEGMPDVPLQWFALNTRPENQPAEVAEFFKVHGFGQGWQLAVQPISPPAKRRSAESRAKTRMNNLQRRVAKTIGPIFSAEVVSSEIARKPDYYAGQADPEHEARIRALDEADAELWEAFCQWASTQPAI